MKKLLLFLSLFTMASVMSEIVDGQSDIDRASKTTELLSEERFLSSILFSESLPDYWHDHLTKIRVGFQALGQPEVLCDEVIVKHFGLYERSIAAVTLYIPPIKLVTTDPLVFFVVHGTWAKGNPEFFDTRNGTFQDMLDFIFEAATRKARPVEIVSYEWSAQDSYEDRELAGRRLAGIAQEFYSLQSGYGPLWGYGHSHGGNVFNIASQEVYFEKLIYCGTPVVEVLRDVYRPLRVGNLYQIYSSSDPIQSAGAYDERTLRKVIQKAHDGRLYKRQDGKRIINLRIQCNGMGLGHLNLKWVFPQLWNLIDTIAEKYQYHDHLDANINSLYDDKGVPLHMPIVTIRSDLTLRDVLPIMRASGDGLKVIEQITQEILFSEQQELLFASRHRGKSIHDADSPLTWFLQNWREFNDVVGYFLPWIQDGACKEQSLIEGAVDF